MAVALGEILRDLRDGAKESIKIVIGDWFEKHKEEMVGAALSASDCILYDDEETYNFFDNLSNTYEEELSDFCREEQIEVEIDYNSKQVAISWNEMYVEPKEEEEPK
jgi:hypothetical protein